MLHAKSKPAVGHHDMNRVGAIINRLRGFTAELKDLFPERERLIDQVMFALLLREHVLIYGIYGTGKSDLLSAVFSGFESARTFSIQLTKFMTESSVFGIPNPKVMREEGRLEHRTAGTALDSEFNEFDEIFDANAALLRSLLTLLNERRFKRGEQVVRAPLHTAIASTNLSPDTAVQREGELAALIDRFLFGMKVEWLNTPTGRQRMYKKFLEGQQSDTKIPYADLKYLSDIVIGENLVNDPYLIEVYDELIQAYRIAAKETKVSDRRAAKLFSIAEANALLQGRLEVIPDDFLSISIGLCPGHDTKLIQLFDTVAKPIIDKANKAKQQSIDDVQRTLLESYANKVPQVPQKMAAADLIRVKRELLGLEKGVGDVKPQTNTVTQYRDQILKTVRERLALVDAQINIPEKVI